MKDTYPSGLNTPIRVRVTLKQKQYLNTMNSWEVTIHGVPRTVTMREVEWYCTSLKDAVGSFKSDEVLSFSITGNEAVPNQVGY